MSDLTPIKNSSNIAACGYDPATKTLTVQFHSGATHDYHEVDSRHFDAMKAAPSVGKYFHTHIRNAHKSRKHEASK